MNNVIETYADWNAQAPFVLAFIKFAVLASLGEALAVRIQTGASQRVLGWPKKAIVWGLLGMWIAWMFPILCRRRCGAWFFLPSPDRLFNLADDECQFWSGIDDYPPIYGYLDRHAGKRGRSNS